MNRIEEMAENVIRAFESGTLVETYQIRYLRRGKTDRPSGSWSFMNQMFMLFGGTQDARGMAQWRNVGRRVKAGSRAVWILAPIRRSFRVEHESIDPATGERTVTQETRQALVGFKGLPVFRLEDTEGDPLPLPGAEHAPAEPPPLADVAASLGLRVRYAGGTSGYYGYYSGRESLIHLKTHDNGVWWHELAHAMDDRLHGPLKGGQDSMQEIVAETSAAILARMYGHEPYIGRAAAYVRGYAHGDMKRVWSLVARICRVVEGILDMAVPAVDAAASQEG